MPVSRNSSFVFLIPLFIVRTFSPNIVTSFVIRNLWRLVITGRFCYKNAIVSNACFDLSDAKANEKCD